VPFWLLGALYLMGTVCWLFIEPKKPVFTDAGARD
jgi:hypothetical protein